MKKVLSIAGSDCSGGAGIQADLKTFSAHGVFGMSVIVSVVAENTSRVIDIQDITPDMIEKQIDAVFEDIEVDAVKIGMLSTPECMKAVAKKLLQYKPQNVVIDPVMYAKNGCPLMNPTAVSTLICTSGAGCSRSAGRATRASRPCRTGNAYAGSASRSSRSSCTGRAGRSCGSGRTSGTGCA